MSSPFGPDSNAGYKWKSGVLVVLFGCVFATIALRLFWVQVVEGARYREIAKRQYESKVPLRADRGVISDRHGRRIATMTMLTSFAADPTVIQRVDEFAQLLAVADGGQADWYRNKIRNEKGRFTWLARGVNAVMFPALDTLRDRGIIRVRESKRHYAYGNVAAQVLGTTDIDNNGLTGLELQYNAILRGQPGFVVMQRDGRGRLRPGINPERQAPANGTGLQLAMDVEFQRIAEEELERGIRETGASGGTVIALHPATGDVLAMASWPTFNPLRLDRATNDAIRIRSITDMYEPGSTMKAFAAAALLEERVLATTDIVDGHQGLYVVDGTSIRDDHPLGKVPFHEALEQSSNVVFASSIRNIDPRVYYKYLRDFGFGLPTGIDLPGEMRGRLRRPNEWDAATPMFISFGYGMSATALQVVSAYAAIANGGVLMQPRIVRAFHDVQGNQDRVVAPRRIRQVISEASAGALTSMLVGVVDRGTGKLAAVNGLRIAGKTGTAQQLDNGTYSRSNYTASFVGFYPAEAPSVAMIVMLDKPTSTIYGGSAAAPIFKRIVQKSITLTTTDRTVQAKVLAASAADSIIVPDVRGLSASQADSVLRQYGLKSNATATGAVVRQSPQPRTAVARGHIVTLECVGGNGQGLEAPNVVGFTIRRAIAVLHGAGYQVRVQGSGRVARQDWRKDTCILVAR
jgi:cell division protein FtsI (penicillin-binding protein 3)